LLVTWFVVVKTVEALLPAAAALAMASLVARLTGFGDRAELLSVALGPLLLFGAVLFVTHAVEALGEPLRNAIQNRVDGAHRARLTRLAAASAALAAVEDRETRRLLRVARADPQNWTERTPGMGAVTQLTVVLNWLGIASSALVIARYAWWPVPVVLATAVLVRRLGIREGIVFYRVWREGIPEGQQAAT
jgi:hypothetical protein